MGGKTRQVGFTGLESRFWSIGFIGVECRVGRFYYEWKIGPVSFMGMESRVDVI